MKLGLLAALLFCACQKLPSASHHSLRLANGAGPQSSDPYRYTGIPGIRIIGTLFEGLTVRGAVHPDVRPGLAKTWEISADGLNYTFHLRECRWSNGKAPTARGAAGSCSRLASPATGAQYAALLDVLKNGPILQKNPYFWDSPSVSLARLEFLPVEHLETAYKMFQNRELDWLFDVPISKMQAVKNQPEYFNFPQYGVYYYALNLKKPPLNNAQVRQALSYAVDRASRNYNNCIEKGRNELRRQAIKGAWPNPPGLYTWKDIFVSLDD